MVKKREKKRAQTFRVANQLSREELKEREEERKLKDKKLSRSSVTGGITGIAISAGLYIFASKISTGFDNSEFAGIVYRETDFYNSSNDRGRFGVFGGVRCLAAANEGWIDLARV